MSKPVQKKIRLSDKPFQQITATERIDKVQLQSREIGSNQEDKSDHQLIRINAMAKKSLQFDENEVKKSSQFDENEVFKEKKLDSRNH